MTTRPAAPGEVRLVWLGVLANTAVGTLFAWGLVAPAAATAAGLSTGQAAGVFAGALGVFTVVVLAAGWLARRLAPAPLLVAAAATGGAGLVLAGVGANAPALWVGVSILFGTANGLAYPVATGTVARVGAAHRGRVAGLVVAAYAAGPIVLGVVGPPLLDAYGWRSGLVGLGVVVAVMLLAAAGLAHDLGPDGQVPGPHGEAVGSGDDAPGTAYRTALLWLVFLGGSAPALLVFAHVAPVAAARGLTGQLAGLAVSALAGGNLVGRLAAGAVSDRVGRVPALGGTLLLLGGSLLGIVVIGQVGQLAAYLGVGGGYGALSALVPAATADLVGRRSFASVYGRVFTAWGAAGLVGPLAGGWLLDRGVGVPATLGLVSLLLVPAAAATLALAAVTRRRG